MEGESSFLVVLRSRGRFLRLLSPDMRQHRVSPGTVAAALAQTLEDRAAEQVEPLLEAAGVEAGRRATVRGALVRDRLQSRQIPGCWLLRLPPGADFVRQLRHAGVLRRAVFLAAAHLGQDVLWIGAWWVLGVSALQGRLDRGWLLAWALLLLTIVPFRMLATWLQGAVAIRAGGVLKQRLLGGSLRLDPDEIRLEGAGQLLGRVLESQAVEALALSGGFLALVAGIELALAGAVLIASGIRSEPFLLVGWLAATLAAAWRYCVANGIWTGARLDMTHELVEKMVGHRTRLAQEPPEDWHTAEDKSLEAYIDRSRRLDRTAAWLTAAVPRGWVIAGVTAMAPAFVAAGDSTAHLAAAVGGILLAYRAFRRLTGGLWQIAGAAIAWKRTALLFHAASRPVPLGSSPARNNGELRAPLPVLEARELTFRYPTRREPVLKGCNLEIERGHRLILEGASGGGKSTLAAVLTGLRQPDSGLLLLNGLDRGTLGAEAWRRGIVTAPQFHENHVLTGTFAFNLMMGCHWPPNPDDFEKMESLCRELGLGDLLDRMPAGLLQTVGDTGWQLSHGERSRLFIARTLLQKPDLVVLDESFAALDPENLRRALDCVLARTPTLLVIAHP